MILNLFRKTPAPNAVNAVYRSIVAQSRQPIFYAEWGVPDTVTGRFDMISLHLSLLFARLRAEPERGTPFGQAVLDLFFRDMDRSLREMGAGDMGVPKKVQKMSSIFFALMTKVNEALEAGDLTTLESVLRRNVFADDAEADTAPLAAYLQRRRHQFAEIPVDDIIAGRLESAEPV
ncbi:ubiquinol-cytochrome C chaperone family protein [Devosia sp.]|uniref:ubiquinol-cytochrome C chaperone family protein n=1 Tax=Devosia sp. TaxID=1871048 RepID=UPI003A8DF331